MKRLQCTYSDKPNSVNELSHRTAEKMISKDIFFHLQNVAYTDFLFAWNKKGFGLVGLVRSESLTL